MFTCIVSNAHPLYITYHNTKTPLLDYIVGLLEDIGLMITEFDADANNNNNMSLVEMLSSPPRCRKRKSTYMNESSRLLGTHTPIRCSPGGKCIGCTSDTEYSKRTTVFKCYECNAFLHITEDHNGSCWARAHNYEDI